jgi:geranylgeranyl diphosphate synthase type II
MEKYLPLLEKEIRALQFGSKPRTLYEPIRYIMALRGKRLRPMLTLLAYAIYKPNIEPCLRYASAVEAFHNFTLMHDDIMDNAPLRRGKPAVHEKWNVNTAILAGDVMLVKVYDMFLGLEGATLKEVLSLFNECAAGVCEGQQLDMEFESRPKVSEEEYIEMTRLKTALLLGFSLELGALLADAPAADRALLREAGINLGIGFQLKDDLLDVYADKHKFGKQVGGDIIANKKTFLLIKAIEKARGNDKQELTRWLSAKKFHKERKVKAVSAIYDRLGIQTLTESKVKEYFEKGFSGLAKVGSEDKLQPLIQFAGMLAGRAH